MPKYFLNDLYFHKKKVFTIEWSPFHEQIFASASEDGKVFLWDNSKSGEEQARHDYQDGPPELIFHHEYHSSFVEDLSWSPFDPFNIVSMETDYRMQIWKVQS
mmetsp:Transcript_42553/g.40808  ORF Transcript_42553/g.40808 Transcript_42553/m.40808 type:complete len:103 (+) Transcript_42553:281-589(+)